MKRFLVLFLVLVISVNSLAQCEQPELHPSLVELEEKAIISILVECGDSALSNAEVNVIYPSGKTEKMTANESGEILLETGEQGTFMFEIVQGKEEVTETVVEYTKELEISIARKSDSYNICIGERAERDYIEIVDQNTLKIMPLSEENCASYTTESNSFTVKSGDTETTAGKKLSIIAPESVLVGEQFVVKVMDNSQPLEKATVSLNGEEKTTNQEGETVFSLSESGEFGIRAEKTGLESAVEKITATEKLKEFEVEFPKKALEKRIIKLGVSYEGQAIENAVIEFNNIKKATDSEGHAFFSFPKKGVYEFKVIKKDFQEFNSSIEVIEGKKPLIKLDALEEINETETLTVTATSQNKPLSGAKIKIGSTEKETDKMGKAEFTGLASGIYEINASKKGYAKTKKRIEVLSSEEGGKTEPPQQGFGLLPHLLLLAGVIIILLGVVRFIRKRRVMR